MDNKFLILLVVLLIIFACYLLSPKIIGYKSDQDPMLDIVRENFGKIDPKYKNIPLRKGNSAYTENKAVITLCLKNPDTGEYYDVNTIMYVALHELAHIISKTHGHNDEFKNNFSKLLKKGEMVGIYNPYLEIPETYCGVGPDD